eukprot:1007317_1
MATHLSDIENTELECEDIQDSIHLSELIFDVTSSASNSLSVLNIPTDVLLHINHFLSANGLAELQKTCRYFRIMARNPLSLYSLHVGVSGNFAAYSYDHIQHLILSTYKHVNGVIEANQNWNNTVHEITLEAKQHPRQHIAHLLSRNTTTMPQESFHNKRGTILGGRMTVHNITKVNIHGAINDVSFYKFILKSFQHAEKIAISYT